MYDVDQYMRNYMETPYAKEYSDKERDFFQQEFSNRWTAIDSANTSDMKELLTRVKWFTISEFGQATDKNAWLIVQHADLDVAFQKKVLAILKDLVPKKETDASNFAYLFDRVAAINEKKPQRYGTQGKCVGPGRWEPHPIEDPANVDKRRVEMGLETMEKYKTRFANICFANQS